MSAEKIGPQHLARKAVLYVRQSSTHQVLHNREGQALQYAMRGRLAQLGWSAIEIVDEDLGRSAAGGTARAGFERMVAEVCLGKVGGVAAREVSRFARNSRDWQQLIEMCRVVDTLLVDQEAVYAAVGDALRVGSSCPPTSRGRHSDHPPVPAVARGPHRYRRARMLDAVNQALHILSSRPGSRVGAK